MRNGLLELNFPVIMLLTDFIVKICRYKSNIFAIASTWKSERVRKKSVCKCGIVEVKGQEWRKMKENVDFWIDLNTRFLPNN